MGRVWLHVGLSAWYTGQHRAGGGGGMADDVGIDGYEDCEPIGQGGFGSVYRCKQVALQRVVAVKVLAASALDEDVRKRFERECRAVGALSGHPHILTVHDSGFTRWGRPYIVMDYMSEGSLADTVRRHGPKPWQAAVDLIVKVAGAVATAHHAGILHRDIKPENVLVSSYREPKLGDFGIASIASATQTQSGVIAVSVAHAAPEVLNGRPSGPEADVYALASTLYTLIGGRPPFGGEPGEPLGSQIARIMTQPPPALGDAAPDSVWNVVERGLAKEPSDRPLSATALAKALQDAQAAEGFPVTPLVVAEPDESKEGTLPGAGAEAEREPTLLRTRTPSSVGEVPAAHTGRTTLRDRRKEERASDPQPSPAQTDSPRRRWLRWGAVAAFVGVCFLVGALLASGRDDPARSTGGSAPAAAGLECDVVLRRGPHSDPGTKAVAEVGDFLDALEPGSVGCIAMDLVEDEITVAAAGTAEERVTIAGIGEDPPTIAASIVVSEASHDLVLRNLTLIAPPSGDQAALTILGSNVALIDSDVSNRGSGPCVEVGAPGTVAVETEIVRNRIHDCGIEGTLPEGAVELRYADRTLVEHNLVHDNVAAGLSLYPRAAFSRIVHNTVVANGTGIFISGAAVCPEGEGAACKGSTRRTVVVSSRNHLAFNVIALSRLSPTSSGDNVRVSFPTPANVPNVLRDNCIWGPRPGRAIEGRGDANEVETTAEFRDPSAGDFTVVGGPPCSRRGAARAVLVDSN